MKKQKVIYFFLNLQIDFANSAFSQTEIKNVNSENYLQFKILESEQVTSKYVIGDVEGMMSIIRQYGCFSYFDSLIKRYNFEKLKTIGEKKFAYDVWGIQSTLPLEWNQVAMQAK